MATMSWTVLTGTQATAGSIRRQVNNPTLDPESVLEDAQAEIYSVLRTREMRAYAPLSVSAAAISVALPSDFLDPISLRDRFGSDMTLYDEDGLLNARAYDNAGAPIQSDPSYYAIFNEAIQFDTALPAAATFQLSYYKNPPRLSASVETNWLTTRYPHLLRAACEKHAYIFLKSESGEQAANRRMMAAIALIVQNDDLTRRGAAPPERW